MSGNNSLHLNLLLAPERSKHFSGNCLINPCALHRIKKKTTVKNKSFPQRSTASHDEPKKDKEKDF